MSLTSSSLLRVEDLPSRKRESYLAWKDAGGTEGAVEVEVRKTAHVLGWCYQSAINLEVAGCGPQGNANGSKTCHAEVQEYVEL